MPDYNYLYPLYIDLRDEIRFLQWIIRVIHPILNCHYNNNIENKWIYRRDHNDFDTIMIKFLDSADSYIDIDKSFS